MKATYSAESAAKLFNVPVTAIKSQYAANAEALGEMLAKAKKSGKKVNGYSQHQLQGLVREYEERSR